MRGLFKFIIATIIFLILLGVATLSPVDWTSLSGKAHYQETCGIWIALILKEVIRAPAWRMGEGQYYT